MPDWTLPSRVANQRAFTLIELIMVMVIIFVLAAIGLARFFDRKAFDADEFAEQSRSMIRYGQKVAVAQNRPVFVLFAGTTVALCFDTACSSTSRVLPAAGSNTGSSATLAACSNTSSWACEAKPTNIVYSVTPAGTTSFYYDAQGRPFAMADAIPSATSTFTPLTITISGDGSSRAVIVERETGYVH